MAESLFMITTTSREPGAVSQQSGAELLRPAVKPAPAKAHVLLQCGEGTRLLGERTSSCCVLPYQVPGHLSLFLPLTLTLPLTRREEEKESTNSGGGPVRVKRSRFGLFKSDLHTRLSILEAVARAQRKCESLAPPTGSVWKLNVYIFGRQSAALKRHV